MKPLIVYKIRNKEGLFSTGGTHPHFTKIGKTWSNIGFLKSHLTQFAQLPQKYLNCEIIELEYAPVEGRKTDINSFFQEASKNHKINDLKQRISNMQYNLPKYEQQKDTWVKNYAKDLEKLKTELKELTQAP